MWHKPSRAARRGDHASVSCGANVGASDPNVALGLDEVIVLQRNCHRGALQIQRAPVLFQGRGGGLKKKKNNPEYLCKMQNNLGAQQARQGRSGVLFSGH